MSAKIKIIIAGYPKSGNTWLTRLVAELVNCPVLGNFKRSKESVVIEGLDRESDFEVYKSHHQLKELPQFTDPSSKIIYIIRDPRDVLISGSYFFNLKVPVQTEKINWPRHISFHWKQLLFSVQKTLLERQTVKKQMYQAILKGNKQLHWWLRTSWKKHMIPYYEDNSVLKVKYEDLLKDPYQQSIRILKFLKLNRKDQYILEAIKRQSFDRVKELAIIEQNDRKLKHVRIGKSGQWQNKLNIFQKRKIKSWLWSELHMLGYESSQVKNKK